MRSFGVSAALVLSFSASLFSFDAQASKRKGLAKKEDAKRGVLVAMDGSASLGLGTESRKNYLGLRLFPYSIVSAESRTGNTTVETPSSTLKTLPFEVELAAHWGSWVIRPEFALDIVKGQALNSSFVSVGYQLNSQFELGGVVALERTTAEDANKTKTVISQFLIGPHGVYYTNLAGLDLEATGRLYIVSGSGEQTANNTTTTVADVSGYGFEAGALLKNELTSGLVYVGGVNIAYQSTTDKADKNNEKKVSSFDFTIIPAGLRFMF